MSTFQDSIPSSIRKPVVSSRFAQELAKLYSRPSLAQYAVAGPRVVVKSRFARLPHEPEDAKLSGVTRSLHRRLLALNIKGSLLEDCKMLLPARIA